MNDFLHFLSNHWLLSLSAVVLFVLVMMDEWQTQTSAITPSDLVQKMNSGLVQVVDCRSEAAFADGHIKDSISIPFPKLRSKDQAPDVSALRDSEIVVVSANTAEGITAKKSLAKLGFKKTILLRGGMGAWEQANMPVVKS